MRCPDCSKFVSMDNGEPEVSNVDTNFSEGEITVTCEIHHTRNCADCGTELKSIDETAEASCRLNEFADYGSLKVVDHQKIAKDINDGKISIEAEDEGAEAEESGGGRYAKNMIAVRVPITVSFIYNGKVFKHSVECVTENPASAYEEC